MSASLLWRARARAVLLGTKITTCHYCNEVKNCAIIAFHPEPICKDCVDMLCDILDVIKGGF